MTQVVFLHIHKCGGTSLRYMLNSVYEYHEQLPVPVAGSHDRHPPYRTINEYPSNYQLQVEDSALEKCSLAMGHYDWQLVQRMGSKTIVLTMLRNPIEQLYSQFRWFWMDTANYAVFKNRYEYSGFDGFLEGTDVARFTNQQTRFLSGRFWGHSPDTLSNGVLTYAKKNLKRSVYGLVERWDESIDLFEKAIGRELPRNIRKNLNEKHNKKVLPDSTVSKAESLQSFDMSLYNYAVKHFEGQS